MMLREENLKGGGPHQPHPGTRLHCCGCSLPGLTGFTVSRCEGTNTGHHNEEDQGYPWSKNSDFYWSEREDYSRYAFVCGPPVLVEPSFESEVRINSVHPSFKRSNYVENLIYWSEREDSNLRPPQPHCGALPSCATLRERAY